MKYKVFCVLKKKKKSGKQQPNHHAVSPHLWRKGMCWPATESIHIPARLKGVRSQLADVTAFSVTHVAVLVSYEPQEAETESQQGGAQQVTNSSQIRDGKTVWVFAFPPYDMHHPVCNTQQQEHLREKERKD